MGLGSLHGGVGVTAVGNGLLGSGAMSSHTMPSRVLCALLWAGLCACAPKVVTVRVPNEPAYAAAVRESLADNSDRIHTCVSSAKFFANPDRAVTSATLVVAEAPSSFEERHEWPFLFEFETCLGRALLDWEPPPAPADRMANVRFHFRPTEAGLKEAVAPGHPFFEVYGLWVDLEVEETERRPFKRAPAMWDARTMSEPMLEDQGQPPWLSSALQARLAGNVYIALCTLTQEGKVVEDCLVALKGKLLRDSEDVKDPEVVRAVSQQLVGRRYKPATYKGKRVSVMYPFQVGFKGR
jgi:hypothetical protein